MIGLHTSRLELWPKVNSKHPSHPSLTACNVYDWVLISGLLYKQWLVWTSVFLEHHTRGVLFWWDWEQKVLTNAQSAAIWGICIRSFLRESFGHFHSAVILWGSAKLAWLRLPCLRLPPDTANELQHPIAKIKTLLNDNLGRHKVRDSRPDTHPWGANLLPGTLWYQHC